jgi:hypothetical protein
MADKVKELLPDALTNISATSGGVFRKENIVSNFTIGEIVAKGAMWRYFSRPIRMPVPTQLRWPLLFAQSLRPGLAKLVQRVPH